MALNNNTTINFLGITTDQRLYKPHKDANILVSALNYPNSPVKITFRRNGATWFEDTVELSPAGLSLYKLSDLDLGKYDVSAEVTFEDQIIRIGTTSFDVAVFELDPFQVIMESKSVSKSKVFTAVVNVRIFHQPYSGPLKVGVFCHFRKCQKVVKKDGDIKAERNEKNE